MDLESVLALVNVAPKEALSDFSSPTVTIQPQFRKKLCPRNYSVVSKSLHYLGSLFSSRQCLNYIEI